MQEESPEGGRFKKEIQIDSQSYLLLIRDEGGAPEMQVSASAVSSSSSLCALFDSLPFDNCAILVISAHSSLSFQFSAWVDAVIFVFSLENEASFNAIYAYYTKMSHYRNAAEIPIILVGTQGQSKKVSGRKKHFPSGMPQPLAIDDCLYLASIPIDGDRLYANF